MESISIASLVIVSVALILSLVSLLNAVGVFNLNASSGSTSDTPSARKRFLFNAAVEASSTEIIIVGQEFTFESAGVRDVIMRTQPSGAAGAGEGSGSLSIEANSVQAPDGELRVGSTVRVSSAGLRSAGGGDAYSLSVPNSAPTSNAQLITYLTNGQGAFQAAQGGLNSLTGPVTAGIDGVTSITNQSVALGKLAPTAASRLFGSASAGNAAAELSLATSLGLTASNLAANLNGDVTSTGSINTVIVNGTVDYAKMQNVSANNRILGSSGSGAGNPPQEITLGIDLSFSGSTLNATGSSELPFSNNANTSITPVLGDAGTEIRTTNNGGSVTFTVPNNASVAYPVGTVIRVLQAGTSLVTFAPGGGVTINSLNNELDMVEQYARCTLLKVATDEWNLSGDLKIPAPTGGTITTHGIFTVHTFLAGSGTFTVQGNLTCSVLVVAGGGGGGWFGGGGGGAGGVIVYPVFRAINGNYTCTVGIGGVGEFQANGRNGGDSVFGPLTATGGGGGGAANNANPGNIPGGSGGGANFQNVAPAPGAGVAGQGFAGGTGNGSTTGGGGGGAGEVGNTDAQGDGGDGIQNDYRTGANVFYGGGGGAARNGSGVSNIGGQGGGGNGEVEGVSDSQNGTANTGGGGGGTWHTAFKNDGADGGSGIVVVRYPTAYIT